MIDDGTYLLCYQYPLSINHMILGFKQHLPLFIIFAGAIFIVSQTVLMNHESSSYLQDDDKKHALLFKNQQQPKQLDSAVQQKQEEHRNKTSVRVPPTSEYKTNENESVPSSSKEQICATPIHHHDTSNLQNNTKNATKKSPRVLYTVFAGRKNHMLLQEPYWAEMHRL
jgi:hypothetical protein